MVFLDNLVLLASPVLKVNLDFLAYLDVKDLKDLLD